MSSNSSISRSPLMVLTALFLGRFAEGNGRKPPREMESDTWQELYDRLFPILGDGRMIDTFKRSFNQDRKHWQHDAEGTKIASTERLGPYASWVMLERDELWERLRKELGWQTSSSNATKLQPGSSPVAPSRSPEPPGRLPGHLLIAASPSLTEIELPATSSLTPEEWKDEREKVLREIVQRRGQPEFRGMLLEAYGRRCAVTLCDAPEALEAAHIVPYSGPNSNNVSNGILLRADIHTLFDLNLIGIEPKSFKIRLSPTLAWTTYRSLEGKELALPAKGHASPSIQALSQRWEEFTKRTR